MNLPLTIPNRPIPEGTFQIRAYQERAHAAIEEAWAEGSRGAMIVMATGTGKTATALSLVVQYLRQGKRVAWLAHREELLTQPRDTVAKFWPDLLPEVGIVQADRDQPEAQLVLASTATLAASPHRVDAILRHGPIHVLVVDEAHHSTSPTHQAAMGALDAEKSLGLTATPDREDGADLSERWEIVFSYSIIEAIRDGALVEPWAAVERLPDLDLSRVSGRRDYDDGELGAELLRAGVVRHTVDTLSRSLEFSRLPDRDLLARKSAEGGAVLVFTATVEQARRTAEALREAGWKARHVSGKTPKLERRRLLKAFQRGVIDVLCNAAVLTEGTDLPRASVVVLGRPTRSWSLFVQMVGRGLRLYPGKDRCLVIDLAGATQVHSLVSAPVLIGGSRCPESPDGVHQFTPDENPQDGAKCDHCKRRVSCGVLLAGHEWGEDSRCTACERAQCVDSDDRRHHWTPVEDFKRQCIDCGATVPDPLAGMAKKRDPEAVEADWVKVRNVAPETWVVDCGDYGLLFVSRRRPGWMPLWLVKGGRKPRPLAAEPIHKSQVRAYADDLARRTAKADAARAGWKGGRPDAGLRSKAWHAGKPVEPGENAGQVTRRLLVDHARARALKTGIAEEL